MRRRGEGEKGRPAGRRIVVAGTGGTRRETARDAHDGRDRGVDLLFRPLLARIDVRARVVAADLLIFAEI